ncbi:GAF domain-containing protein [Mycolicibacterium sp. 018/SC-01/001]|uniref:GAF domain-containing protein n=1 Tax=Mycolicibacterium sp. 018/SC-01/001 TaxID=2592069 RepID=UPI001181499A|nr:GAF domain-containing protein [Mycolicibacterium sp. 018/SC-01/001]TRW80311.1 GAF domain-containing protein [Mycolicibacterium sp. 018/SC-01/001]
MSDAQPHTTDTTPGLAPVAGHLDRIARQLGVKSVLVMRSEADSMVVAGTAGEATRHYTVGGAGKKALDDQSRVPLYCERVVDEDRPLFVRDSRDDDTFAGNEDEVEFGLHNYLGVPIHNGAGDVVGTVCVLDDSSREYSDEERRQLSELAGEVERIVSNDDSALG